MKLLRVKIISSDTCGGLLDGLDLKFREEEVENEVFSALCLVGPNGSGKSQFLQLIAEIFQAIFHACVPDEEARDGNDSMLFEIEYLVRPTDGMMPFHVKASRTKVGRGKPKLILCVKNENNWEEQELSDRKTVELLPQKVIGYTSGDNETLSLPFLVSRAEYADRVYSGAKSQERSSSSIPETRLMLIDYGTNLEVLAANLLMGTDDEQIALLKDAQVENIHSFRCIIQLNHSAAPTGGVLLTEELSEYIENLKRCATAFTHDEKTNSYQLDFWVNKATRFAFSHFWDSTLDLFSAFHKLAMLNDLAIPRPARQRFKSLAKNRRFAARLPEPQDEDKVFRFEQIGFFTDKRSNVVDYVSLSDGEHQLAQILGTLSMVSQPNVLFLLDEPESHFNPQWRVRFISRVNELPSRQGAIAKDSAWSNQECFLTTHAPFVPSDMSRKNVLIFSKTENGIEVKRPEIETYGTTFDTILEECFDVHPPISQLSRDEIDRLNNSTDTAEVRAGLKKLGSSVDRAFLADHLRQLEGGEN